MKITCSYGEFEVFGYRDPGTRKLERAVSIDSLAHNLRLSFKRLPTGPGVRYVELDGRILVPVTALNAWLVAVRAHPELLNRLTLDLSERSSRDVGFLSYAHIQLQEALTELGAYYVRVNLEAEYAADEVEDALYQIFCEFLTCGSYDPLLMERDRQPMSASEAWMLSILETTAAALIMEYIQVDRGEEDILVYLQITLKDRVSGLGFRIAEMASSFTTPEDL